MDYAKWDPCWGWNDQIYYLQALYPRDSYELFWQTDCGLYSKNKLIYKTNNRRLCAGTFSNDNYFGSFAYDDITPKGYGGDESIYVTNKNWEIITEFRPSEIINKPSDLLSRLEFNGQLICGFRDPVVLPNGNLAVCTAGHRYGNLQGNICEVKFIDNQFNIEKETIIDDSLRIFTEIERVTVWNEYIFFSVNGIEKYNKYKKIQVGKLTKNGNYKYFGEVANSEGCYGPNVSKDLKLLYWYTSDFVINNPESQNLFYKNGEWSIEQDIYKYINFSDFNYYKYYY